MQLITNYFDLFEKFKDVLLVRSSETSKEVANTSIKSFLSPSSSCHILHSLSGCDQQFNLLSIDCEVISILCCVAQTAET